MSEVEDIIARAYDAEEASQMGEPSPWSAGADDKEWVSERHACARAALMALDAAGYFIAPKAEATVLTEWIELWDKVCDAADPDDEQELPPWSEVVKQVLPEWNGEHVVSAEYWSEYQRAMLVDAVRDFRRAMRPEAAKP